MTASHSDANSEAPAPLNAELANDLWHKLRLAGEITFEQEKDILWKHHHRLAKLSGDLERKLRALQSSSPASASGERPFLHAFSIKVGKDDGVWFLHGEELVPGLNLCGEDLGHVLADLLPAWKALHDIAPGQVPAPPAAPLPAATATSESFEAWLCREMPEGTVIGDPKWWAPRIARAFARSETGWIECSERMPPDPRSISIDRLYLVVNDSNVQLGRWTGDKWLDLGWYEITRQVTHWMPLPSAPHGDGNARKGK